MSRIGKRIITIPNKVEAKLQNHVIHVKGPLGELSQPYSKQVTVVIENHEITVNRNADSLEEKALHGTTNALIKNLITGVTEGFKKELLIKGVGYRAKTEGNQIVLSVGYSHPVQIEIPKGIKIEIEKGTKITIEGIDKVVVGQIAANIRKVRKPSPYSGKGVMYHDEIVRRKEGKTAKS